MSAFSFMMACKNVNKTDVVVFSLLSLPSLPSSLCLPLSLCCKYEVTRVKESVTGSFTPEKKIQQPRSRVCCKVGAGGSSEMWSNLCWHIYHFQRTAHRQQRTAFAMLLCVYVLHSLTWPRDRACWQIVLTCWLRLCFHFLIQYVTGPCCGREGLPTVEHKFIAYLR